MIVTLPPEWAQYVNQLVASGRYEFPEEAVCLALQMLKNWEDLYTIRLEELRKDVAIGLEQANRGELLDGKEVFQRLREKLQARTASQP
jgi:antitoxin ParD1/3/4